MVEQRKVTVLVGGSEEVFKTVLPVLRETAENVVRVGGNGMGLYAKLVNNLVLGVYVASLAEAFNMGIRAGLDKEQMVEVLDRLSSIRSPTSAIKLPKLLNGDYSTQFALKHMRKDLEIIQSESKRLRTFTVLSDLAMQLYRGAEGLGLSEMDFAAILELYRRLTEAP